MNKELKVWQLQRIAKIGYKDTDKCATLLYNLDYTPIDLLEVQTYLTTEELIHISIEFGCQLTEETHGVLLKYKQ
jgi:hypothetical protein